MTELKKEFEKRFCAHKQIAKDKWEADYSRPIDLPAKYVWQWIEQKIDEACKNAKIEECKYWQDFIFRPHVSVEQITVIDFGLRLAELDSPSPKEIK